jgi:hypothetical protein
VTDKAAADRDGHPAPPDSAELAERLGPASDLWIQLQEGIRSRCSAVTERWVNGGRKYGWSCRLEQGKKGILYLIPDDGYFRIGIALSDAAREAALAADLPIEIRESLAAATKAMEGWPVRMPIRSAADVATALRLAEFKLS